MQTKSRGFVLIELVVVFGMMAVLIGLTIINVFGVKRKASLTATIDVLVSDIKSQQTKAMSATVQNGSVQLGYGIRFDATQYTLFKGLAYNAIDTSNAVIPLDSRIMFNAIAIPDNSIVFASQSGEIVGYVPTQNSVSIHHTDSGETKTVQINQYGVITSVN